MCTGLELNLVMTAAGEAGNSSNTRFRCYHTWPDAFPAEKSILKSFVQSLEVRNGAKIIC